MNPTTLLALLALAAGDMAPVADDAAPDGTPPLPCKPAPEGMACVPGGWFIRGSDEGPKDARPQERVWVQTFYMDLNEVTTEAYKACVARKECPKAGPNYKDYSRPRQPIVGVSWYDAQAFCEAHGKRLPTEAEWEKAARGPAGETHPWGNAPATCERAVIKDARGRSCGVKKRFGSPEKGRTLEVGSRPAGRYGLFDMSGNSWEWVADWYSKSYAKCGDDCRGKNPKGPCGGADRCPKHYKKVVRGGSWYWPASHATGVYRRAHIPKNDPYFHHFGFRCAAGPGQAETLRAQ